MSLLPATDAPPPAPVDLMPPVQEPQVITASDGTQITMQPDGSSIIGGNEPERKKGNSFDENLKILLKVY